MTSRCRPVVICGPSGVGKGTLIELLQKQFSADKFGVSVHMICAIYIVLNFFISLSNLLLIIILSIFSSVSVIPRGSHARVNKMEYITILLRSMPSKKRLKRANSSSTPKFMEIITALV